MDSMGDLQKNPQAAALLAKIMERATASYGDVAKNVQMPEAVQRPDGQNAAAVAAEAGGKAVPPAMVQQLNATLNKNKKEN